MIRTLILAGVLSAGFALPAHAQGPAAGADETQTAPRMTGEIREALEAGGELVVVDVLGMVCDFCAVAMTKTFNRRDEVAAVDVDLDAKTLTFVVEDGRTLDDALIEDLVRRSGYRLSEIRRGEEV